MFKVVRINNVIDCLKKVMVPMYERRKVVKGVTTSLRQSSLEYLSKLIKNNELWTHTGLFT